jgi:hypothetical protein
MPSSRADKDDLAARLQSAREAAFLAVQASYALILSGDGSSRQRAFSRQRVSHNLHHFEMLAAKLDGPDGMILRAEGAWTALAAQASGLVRWCGVSAASATAWSVSLFCAIRGVMSDFIVRDSLESEDHGEEQAPDNEQLLSRWPEVRDALRQRFGCLPERSEVEVAIEQEFARATVPRVGVSTRLSIEGSTVLVNGRHISLNLTAERTEDALAFLGELLKEPGSWKSSPEIGKATSKEGVRFDRVFKELPDTIKSQVQSNRRKGYRVRLA